MSEWRELKIDRDRYAKHDESTSSYPTLDNVPQRIRRSVENGILLIEIGYINEGEKPQLWKADQYPIRCRVGRHNWRLYAIEIDLLPLAWCTSGELLARINRCLDILSASSPTMGDRMGYTIVRDVVTEEMNALRRELLFPKAPGLIS